MECVMLTAKELSAQYFKGTRSPWSLVQDARRGALPSIKIGARTYFNLELVDKAVKAQFEASYNPKAMSQHII